MNLESLIQSYGYYAVLAGAMLEGETIMALAGYAAHRGYLSLPWVVVLGAIGATIGDQLYFLIGRRAGPSVLDRFPAAARVLPRFEAFARRRPALVVIALRFMYGLRTIGPIALGASRMSITKFAMLNAAGAVLWAVVFAGAGYALGQTLEMILADAKRLQEAVFAAIAIAGLVVWLVVRRRRR
jgi:membrane protein DedA with SNARE-associated domain